MLQIMAKTKDKKANKPPKHYSDEERRDFLLILQKRDGHVAKACEAFGIPRKTFYRWKDIDWFLEELNAMQEKDLDDAEEMLRLHRKGVPNFLRDKDGKKLKDENGKDIVDGWIIKPDPKTTMSYLEKKAKERGYGKHKVVDLNINGMPQEASIGLTVHKKKDAKKKSKKKK